MTDDVRFRDDLYVGAEEDYQRYRPAYPARLLDRLTEAAGANGHGQLVDLACGTGLVAVVLAGRFQHVLAVDQEPDMVRVGRLTAERYGLSNMEWRVGAVEALTLPAGTFDLVTAGNAFHRLPRQVVARKVFGWLRPGGSFALLWGSCTRRRYCHGSFSEPGSLTSRRTFAVASSARLGLVRTSSKPSSRASLPAGRPDPVSCFIVVTGRSLERGS